MPNKLQEYFDILSNKINKYLKRKKNLFLKRKSNGIFLTKNGIRKKIRCPKGLKVIFMGINGRVEFEYPIPKFENTSFILEDDSTIKIGKKGQIKASAIYATGKSNSIIIGNNFTMCGGYIANRNESNLVIKIGENCLFSANIYMRASDAHTIYDTKTREILNKPEKNSITIGNNVWLTNSVTILKNSNIPNNCIVGKNSLINKKFNETNCLIVGTPAKITKRNVDWDIRDTEVFQKEQI